MPLGLRSFPPNRGSPFLPRSQDELIEEPHVAWPRLEQLEFAGKQTAARLEHRGAALHGQVQGLTSIYAENVAWTTSPCVQACDLDGTAQSEPGTG